MASASIRSVDAVLDAVHARITDLAAAQRALAAAGDPLFRGLVDLGRLDGLDRALAELADDAPSFRTGTE